MTTVTLDGPVITIPAKPALKKRLKRILPIGLGLLIAIGAGCARLFRRIFSCLLLILPPGARRAHSSPRPKANDRPARVEAAVKPLPQDDSLVLAPAQDLALQPEGKRKAEALT